MIIQYSKQSTSGEEKKIREFTLPTLKRLISLEFLNKLAIQLIQLSNSVHHPDTALQSFLYILHIILTLIRFRFGSSPSFRFNLRLLL